MAEASGSPGGRWEEATGPHPSHRFRVYLPIDFRRLDLPPEQPDFSKPDAFLPLMICMATYGAVILTVGIRPAFGQGAVGTWVQELCRLQQVNVYETSRCWLAGRIVFCCDAVQQSDAGPMHVRLHFFEDAGTLWQVSIMAPQAIWPSAQNALFPILGSMQIATQPDQSVPLVEGEAEPTMEPATRQASEDRPTRFEDVALADDAATLDPEHETNARLRDNGIGLVPKVVKVDPEEKSATLAAAAVEATFKVPLGWHVIDDGRRTLVFDPGGKIQVNLDQRPTNGQTPEQIFDSILDNLRESSPRVEHIQIELGGMPCLAVRGLVINGETLEQAYLLRPGSRNGLTLVTRVTADPPNMVRAMNVAEVVLRELTPAGQ
jgi:hypothetical protein